MLDSLYSYLFCSFTMILIHKIFFFVQSLSSWVSILYLLLKNNLTILQIAFYLLFKYLEVPCEAGHNALGGGNFLTIFLLEKSIYLDYLLSGVSLGQLYFLKNIYSIQVFKFIFKELIDPYNSLNFLFPLFLLLSSYLSYFIFFLY